MTTTTDKYLFGGSNPWSTTDWTASDDRVRGGSSISYLEPTPTKSTALFKGTLDTKTLGGAGFASQRTTADRTWNLSCFDGLELSLDVDASDEKLYTLILKDEVLPRRPDGRERSSLSWEVDFRARDGDGSGKIIVRWSDLRATYRGKEVKDVEPLDLKGVKRLSVMMRSFFGTQEGAFVLSIKSIAGWNDEEGEGDEDEKKGGVVVETREYAEEEDETDEEKREYTCCAIM